MFMLPQQIRQPLRPWLDHLGAVNQPLWQALLRSVASLLMARPGECGVCLHAYSTAGSFQRCIHAFLPDRSPWHCSLHTRYRVGLKYVLQAWKRELCWAS